MPNILSLLECFALHVSSATIRQLGQIIPAMLMMSGRVTMLGMSRWTEKGGSYRNIQRFFYTNIPWAKLFWVFFQQYLLKSDDVYLLVGDESVVTKSGKKTHGMDRFFSSLYGKAIPGLAFFALSLVNTKERKSYPMSIKQRVRSEAEKAEAKRKKAKKKKAKGKVGRPKGSKNKDKSEIILTDELSFIQSMIRQFLSLAKGVLPLTYLVLDGHFGNKNALHMTQQCGLHLISKLRHDAALYFPYEGVYQGQGRPRKYAEKVDCHNLPEQYLKQSTLNDHIQTRIYQANLLNKQFPQALNVVIIVKTNLETGKSSHVILFSSDLNLTYDLLIDYYSLRFQIEFNFRDAKQYWGLEDFMNTTETAVHNAANLSLFMVNFSHFLLTDLRQYSPQAGILDLKTYFRGCKYVTETLKLLPKMPDPILIHHIFQSISQLGSIHHSHSHFNSS